MLRVASFVFDLSSGRLDPDTFDDLSEQFADRFEGVLSRRDDQLITTVYFDSDEVGLEPAILSLIEEVEAELDLRVREVDLDLVTISDIAERTGRTRQGIRLLVNGSRGPGSFPAPLGVPGGSRVWDWAAVNLWLRDGLSLGDTETGLSRGLIFKVNAKIAQIAERSPSDKGREHRT